jgi:hypothetical protein
MFLGLCVVAAGIVTLVWSTGAGLAVLAVGMGVYLAGVVISVVGVILVYREARPARPHFIELRWSLLHDAAHARAATTRQLEGAQGPTGRSEASRAEDAETLRHSPHWRRAVWGFRALGPGLAVVVAGLLAFLWSTPTATVILAVGLGLYLGTMVYSFLEVHWAYGDVQPLRPSYPRARRNLLHDALHARS